MGLSREGGEAARGGSFPASPRRGASKGPFIWGGDREKKSNARSRRGVHPVGGEAGRCLFGGGGREVLGEPRADLSVGGKDCGDSFARRRVPWLQRLTLTHSRTPWGLSWPLTLLSLISLPPYDYKAHPYLVPDAQFLSSSQRWRLRTPQALGSFASSRRLWDVDMTTREIKHEDMSDPQVHLTRSSHLCPGGSQIQHEAMSDPQVHLISSSFLSLSRCFRSDSCCGTPSNQCV